jgi:uncharacterized protein (TIGR03435 family)
MLRNLLEERLHLVYHMQTKVLSGYELATAAAGPKVQESATDPNTPEAAPQPKARVRLAADGFPILPPGVHGDRPCTRWKCLRWDGTAVAVVSHRDLGLTAIDIDSLRDLLNPV